LDKGCDPFAQPLLSGRTGTEGFDLLVVDWELAQVALVADEATRDLRATRASASRDLVLALTWYVERYLGLLREKLPAEYKKLAGDDCWGSLLESSAGASRWAVEH